jgi:HEAT repeat protein
MAVLLNALEKADQDARSAAARGLERMGFRAKAAVPALRRLLAQPDRDDRLDAACALAAIEPGEQGPSEVLAAELLDQHKAEILTTFLPAVQSTARVSLTGEFSTDELDVFKSCWERAQLTREHAVYRRKRAAGAMRHLGGDAPVAVSALRQVAEDPSEDPEVRAEARRALAYPRAAGKAVRGR